MSDVLLCLFIANAGTEPPLEGPALGGPLLPPLPPPPDGATPADAADVALPTVDDLGLCEVDAIFGRVGACLLLALAGPDVRFLFSTNKDTTTMEKVRDS